MNIQNNHQTLLNILWELKAKMSELGIYAEAGLGKDLFVFISSLTPIVNVDLLVYNSKGQFILSRRNDAHCGIGWHVPGGCIRFKESIESRIRKVAESELNLTDFQFNKEPLKVFEIICNEHRNIDNQDERAHFVTLVYKCYAPDSYHIDNTGKTESDSNYLKWFDKLPDDLLHIQQCYKEIMK